MIIDKLKSWEYYKNKLPLYIRNAYGIQEHFKMFFSLLVNLDDTEDNVVKCFDIFAEDYPDFIKEIDKSSTQDQFMFLDMLGKLYGVNRTFNVTYTSNDTTITEQLHLNNEELLLLIKTQIIQNNYDGSYRQCREFYDKIGLNLLIINTQISGNAYLFIEADQSLSENVKSMIKANLLTLKSMGISYSTDIVDISTIGTWADASSTLTSFNKWNVSKWN